MRTWREAASLVTLVLPGDRRDRGKEEVMIGRSGMKLGILLFLVVLSGVSAFGHKPLPFGEVHGDASHALLVHDTDVSQVAYFEITAVSPQYWLAFDAVKGEGLALQIGVPVIDRYRTFRPALAVLGPGLPAIELGFAIPQGCGGVILSTQAVADPPVFHEPFTGTDSWTLREDTLTLPSGGRYFVVLFSPHGEAGKLWAAIGEKEAFGLADFLNLPGVVREVRGFHEVAGRPAWLDTAGWIVFGLVAIAFWWTFGR
jgi:hypothetical protein